MSFILKFVDSTTACCFDRLSYLWWLVLSITIHLDSWFFWHCRGDPHTLGLDFRHSSWAMYSWKQIMIQFFTVSISLPSHFFILCSADHSNRREVARWWLGILWGLWGFGSATGAIATAWIYHNRLKTNMDEKSGQFRDGGSLVMGLASLEIYEPTMVMATLLLCQCRFNFLLRQLIFSLTCNYGICNL